MRQRRALPATPRSRCKVQPGTALGREERSSVTDTLGPTSPSPGRGTVVTIHGSGGELTRAKLRAQGTFREPRPPSPRRRCCRRNQMSLHRYLGGSRREDGQAGATVQPRGLAPLGRDPGPRPGLGCQTASGSTRSESTAKWLTTGAQTTRLRLKSALVPSHTRHTPLHVTGSWVTRQSPLPRAHGPGVSRRRWRSLGLSGQHPSEADSLAPHGTLSCQGHPPVPAAAATSSRLTPRRCSDHICEKGWLRWRKGRTACP